MNGRGTMAMLSAQLSIADHYMLAPLANHEVE
ncbi:hypothetical protein J2T08_005797 [Neorhizobium galegae]|nr:hypothetical protein [Neorhizobium galegae]